MPSTTDDDASVDGDAEAQQELNDRSAEFEAASEGLEPFMRDTCRIDFGD